MKIAFIITRKRNNVVVLFATLKVQSFMLTEVRNCDLLIVVTSSTFLKRKDTLKENRQLAQIMYMCMSVYMYSYTFICTRVWVYICEKTPQKWQKCESFRGNGLSGWRPERAMDQMDLPRTSIDERMLSGRRAVVIV